MEVAPLNPPPVSAVPSADKGSGATAATQDSGFASMVSAPYDPPAGRMAEVKVRGEAWRQDVVMIPGRKRAARNVLTRMEESQYAGGPFSLLHRCVSDGLRVRVYTRGARSMRGICTGYLVAYDKHWNLALVDVDEVYRNPVPEPTAPTKKKRVRKKKPEKNVTFATKATDIVSVATMNTSTAASTSGGVGAGLSCDVTTTERSLTVIAMDTDRLPADNSRDETDSRADSENVMESKFESLSLTRNSADYVTSLSTATMQLDDDLMAAGDSLSEGRNLSRLDPDEAARNKDSLQDQDRVQLECYLQEIECIKNALAALSESSSDDDTCSLSSDDFDATEIPDEGRASSGGELEGGGLEEGGWSEPEIRREGLSGSEGSAGEGVGFLEEGEIETRNEMEKPVEKKSEVMIGDGMSELPASSGHKLNLRTARESGSDGSKSESIRTERIPVETAKDRCTDRKSKLPTRSDSASDKKSECRSSREKPENEKSRLPREHFKEMRISDTKSELRTARDESDRRRNRRSNSRARYNDQKSKDKGSDRRRSRHSPSTHSSHSDSRRHTPTPTPGKDKLRGRVETCGNFGRSALNRSPEIGSSGSNDRRRKSSSPYCRDNSQRRSRRRSRSVEMEKRKRSVDARCGRRDSREGRRGSSERRGGGGESTGRRNERLTERRKDDRCSDREKEKRSFDRAKGKGSSDRRKDERSSDRTKRKGSSDRANDKGSKDRRENEKSAGKDKSKKSDDKTNIRLTDRRKDERSMDRLKDRSLIDCRNNEGSADRSRRDRASEYKTQERLSGSKDEEKYTSRRKEDKSTDRKKEERSDKSRKDEKPAELKQCEKLTDLEKDKLTDLEMEKKQTDRQKDKNSNYHTGNGTSLKKMSVKLYGGNLVSEQKLTDSKSTTARRQSSHPVDVRDRVLRLAEPDDISRGVRTMEGVRVGVEVGQGAGYQAVLTRHMNQVLLRGEHVVMVAVDRD